MRIHPSREKVLHRLKDVLWALAFAGLVAGVGRFVFGLAAATNMLDALPWGWWKIFNMVAGAAVATSGFVVAAIVYIFQSKRYRPVARLSVVIGFLGYGSSLFSLFFDIGLPHRGWHPFFMWNPHSFLFEVFWCVSIYWGVTALELVPLVTERLPLQKLTHWLHERMLPFVVLGITLSTMHHSSLGSLFMTSPTRLHPLWHSLWIPPEFFVSAMGAGLATIVLVYLFTAWLYDHERDLRVLSGLALGSVSMLAFYLILKIADFTLHDKWSFVFGPEITWESRLFWAEISLQAILPIAVLAWPRARRSAWLLTVGCTSAFVGLIVHRLDTGIAGYFRSAGAVYTPSASELVLSFGIVAATGIVFLFLIEKFHILDDPELDAEAHGDEEGHVEVDPWTRQELWSLLTGTGAQRVLRIMVIAIPLAVLALQDQATGAFEPIRQPVDQAVRSEDNLRTVFRLDANRNGMVTVFTHERHKLHLQKEMGLTQEQACVQCHHLDLPKDKNSACRRCHQDMEIETEIFRLENHRDRFETEADYEAFLEVDLGDREATFKACFRCHEKTMKGLASYELKGFSPVAPGFQHAMHGSCLTCHRQRELEKKDDPADPKSRGNCTFCHRDWADRDLFTEEEMAALDPGVPPELLEGLPIAELAPVEE